MPYSEVLDSSIVLSDILVPNQAYYTDYTNSVCAFVMNIWPGIKYVNGISMDLIKYLGTYGTTCKATNNIIEFQSATGYGVTSDWSIPQNGLPERDGDYANYLGYYVYQGQEKLVIYGFFDENGYIKQVRGSLSDPVTLYIDSWDWIYQDPITELDRITHYPVISGCRIDALPARNDCYSSVVQKYFDFTALNPNNIIGDIPILFLGNGTWYWDSPGVWTRI